MILNNEMAKVIAKMEYLVGENCYNPNSYDGYRDEYGCWFRYPVHVRDEDGSQWKYRGAISEISAETVDSMHYKFGTNRLYIGDALVAVLRFLEDRYDIDFNELEERL